MYFINFCLQFYVFVTVPHRQILCPIRTYFLAIYGPILFVPISVVIICHVQVTVMIRFMFAAQDQGMTNGDYAFFTYASVANINIVTPWALWNLSTKSVTSHRMQAFNTFKQVICLSRDFVFHLFPGLVLSLRSLWPFFALHMFLVSHLKHVKRWPAVLLHPSLLRRLPAMGCSPNTIFFYFFLAIWLGLTDAVLQVSWSVVVPIHVLNLYS